MPPPSEQLERAAEALARGQIVCIPTETTYGLAADIRISAALERLVALKGRDADAPFGLIAADVDQARSLALVWPDRADALARRYWPGPLTLVVPARRDLPRELVGPGGCVGVRVSSHAWPRELAGRVGAAITATSANPSGGEPALSVARAREYFGDDVSVYLDAGEAGEIVASTVVQISASGATQILRAGVIRLEQS